MEKYKITQCNISSRFQWVSALILSTSLTACSLYGNTADDKQLSTCKHWDFIKFDQYEVHNNVWDKRDIKNFEQCIYKDTISNKQSIGWRWDWPAAKGNIKAYPSILYGLKPWNLESTTPDLPIKLDDIALLKTEFQIDEKSKGGMNLLIDAWITDNNRPQPHNRIAELAIHIYQKQWQGQAGKYIETVLIDGVVYDFYKHDNMTVHGDNHSWDYLGFVHKGKPKFSGNINIKHFTDYLVKNGHLNKNSYLSSIEFGNEITHGQGETRVSHFQVDVKAKQ